MTQRVNKSSIVGKSENTKSSWNISCILQSFLPRDGGDGMIWNKRFIYPGERDKEITLLTTVPE